jgi:5-(carboxyamino)imidazole ribonucleotide mutase
VATFAIGEAGAINAALFAIELLAHDDDQLHKTLVEYRRKRHDDAVSSVLPPA